MKRILSSIWIVFLSLSMLFAADPKISFSWDDNTKEIESTASFISEDGYFTITSLGSTTPSARNKEGYVNAIKCATVEIDMTSFNSGAGLTIGSVDLAVQNGSGGNVTNVTVSYHDGNEWSETEFLALDGNATTTYSPPTIVSKGKVQKIKFGFSNNASWLYGVKVFESTLTDSNPAFLSASPAKDSFLPSTGTITLTFDELMKAGIGEITLGTATIDGIAYKGNTVEITYSEFNENSSLAVPAEAIVDLEDNPLYEAISTAYLRDVTPPKSIAYIPGTGEMVHVSDLGEDARKIRIIFDEPIKVDESKAITFCNKDKTICATTVSAEAEGSVLVVSYDGLGYAPVDSDGREPQYLHLSQGFVLDLSDNPMYDVTYIYQTGYRDAYNPAIHGRSIPRDEVVLQPVSGSISFWFDEIVLVKSQDATINGQPAVLSSSGKTIGMNYTALPYDGAQIDVYVPITCIADTCDNYYIDPIEFSFWTKAKPSNLSFLVVPDDYQTIQEAIDGIADDSERTFIFLRKGTYNEKLCVWKDNVSLIGEDADEVIITWDECASTSTVPPSDYGTGINSAGTDASYTMLITGDNFYGENFTVRNDYDYAAGEGIDANRQAVALEHKDGDKHVLKNVKMYSFQDTYYPKSANKRQYLTNCYILGGTDFIFGSGTAFIDNSVIDCYEGGQYITAAADTEKEFGIVVNNSEIKYAGKTPIGSKREFYLGRPWKSPAKTAFVNNQFEDGLIRDEGWSIWSGTENHLTATYAEYGNTFLNGNPMNTDSHVDWSVQLSAEEAGRFNINNVFNYEEYDVWNPLGFSTEPDEITTFAVTSAGELTWDEPSHAIGYLIFKNGNFLANATSNSYTDTESGNGDLYEVAAYNEYGATTAKISGILLSLDKVNAKEGFVKNTVVSDYLSLQNAEDIFSIEIVNINGQKVFSTHSVSPEISISDLQPGFYFAIGKTNDNRVYVDKIIKE